VARTLALLWGVTPVVTEGRDFEYLERFLIDARLVRRGAIVVFINVSPELNRSDSNFLNVQRIG
jgi:hypothetical protein